jgi:hypothetical protein
MEFSAGWKNIESMFQECFQNQYWSSVQEGITLNQCLKKAFFKVKIGDDIPQSLKEIQS